ncbi:NAD(P)H-hydrate dehydratase [Periweissella cryptocerci]|uniref:ADP-dependent (S)-NAD(P)H-hydrate dehydratase n=1 Tax=Periweissella cryptocerci TaxID=2506420 RepID=A0A4P6YVB4_9LACO|nr:NAD(P)H-hydrate dehydratase [Periweissella cryptocerci]QBO36693.1 NAD(P)H-hydrate dehydratase [Periweissella cryptocerci]
MQVITEQVLRDVIKIRPEQSHKGTFGRIMLIGGHNNYHGAIIMSTMAAVNAGAGLVTSVTDAKNVTALNIKLPEAMVIDMRQISQIAELITSQDVIVIGPGLDTDDMSLALLNLVLNHVTADQSLVIDGSALTLLSENDFQLPKTKITVLTPHEMEWQRVSGIPIAIQTPANNQQAADELGAVVVLKKHHSEIYQPNVAPQQLLVGGPYQATGGMGDTLAGLIGGFLAQFPDKAQATIAATYAHSAIAEEIARDQYVVLPTQISAALPTYMARFAN